MTIVPISEGRQAGVLPRIHKVVLEELSLDVDIGFHAFEIGAPQRLLVTIHATIDLAHWPQDDTPEASWDYDCIRTGILELVHGRRFNLQETLAQEIFAMLAARPGVAGLSVFLQKPDVYADAKSVGVLLSSG